MNEELYTFQCPACQSALNVPVSLAGVTGPCPICSHEITAPSPRAIAETYFQHQQPEQGYYDPTPQSEEQASAAYSEQNWAEEPNQADPDHGYAAYAPEPQPYYPESYPQQPQPQTQNWAAPEPTQNAWNPEQVQMDQMEEENAYLPLPVSPTLAQSPPLETSRSNPQNSRRLSKPMFLALIAGGVAIVGLGAWTIQRQNAARKEGISRPIGTVMNTIGTGHDGTGSGNPAATTENSEKASDPLKPATVAHVDAPKEETPPAEKSPLAPTSSPVEHGPLSAPTSLDPASPTSTSPTSTSPPKAAPVLETEKATPNAVQAQTEHPPRAADPSLVAAPEAAPAEAATQEDAAAEAYIRQPRRVLEQFLAAKTWKERLKYCLNGETIQAEMQEYYRENPDSQVAVQSVTYLDSARADITNNRVTFFEVACNGAQPFPVIVEESKTGVKVDWHGFVEFKDLRLPKFFEKFSPEPGVFRVVMRRSHYFSDDVPDKAKKVSFLVEPPVKGYDMNYAWVDADNQALLEKVGVAMEYNRPIQPTVTLRWVKDASGTAYVMLEDVIAKTWRSEELRKKAEVQPETAERKPAAKITAAIRPGEGK